MLVSPRWPRGSLITASGGGGASCGREQGIRLCAAVRRAQERRGRAALDDQDEPDGLRPPDDVGDGALGDPGAGGQLGAGEASDEAGRPVHAVHERDEDGGGVAPAVRAPRLRGKHLEHAGAGGALVDEHSHARGHRVLPPGASGVRAASNAGRSAMTAAVTGTSAREGTGTGTTGRITA